MSDAGEVEAVRVKYLDRTAGWEARFVLVHADPDGKASMIADLDCTGQAIDTPERAEREGHLFLRFQRELSDRESKR